MCISNDTVSDDDGFNVQVQFEIDGSVSRVCYGRVSCPIRNRSGATLFTVISTREQVTVYLTASNNYNSNTINFTGYITAFRLS